MRAYTPGGRFTTDFELNAIADGITADSTNPVGTTAQWWAYNAAASVRDPVYDVEPIGSGRVWTGPATLKVIKAIINQGSSAVNERGFYNTDSLRLVLNVDDLRAASPSLFDDRGVVKSTLDLANKYRVVWKNQVYRPIKTQQQGQVAERHTIISVDLLQLMPDELVNDAQFLAYAQA
jgi:hypothetical protein